MPKKPTLTTTAGAPIADKENSHHGRAVDCKQVMALFKLFDAGQKARLFLNVAEATSGIPHEAERQGAFQEGPPGLRSRRSPRAR